MPAVVAVIIVVAAVAFGVLVVVGRGVWYRAQDRRRARDRQLPFAGRVQIRAVLPSLVAPQIWQAVRDFHVPSLVKAWHYEGGVLPCGVLTVASRGGRTELAWEPDPKSRRRGARAWQLEEADIDHIRVSPITFDLSAPVTVRTVDGSAIRLEIANAADLRRALAATPITMVSGREEDRDRSAIPRTLAPLRARSRGEDPALYGREMISEIEGRQASLAHMREAAARRKLTAVPSLDGRTRTWNEVAEFLWMTPTEAWRLLKDQPPEELARLGLLDQDPPTDRRTAG